MCYHSGRMKARRLIYYLLINVSVTLLVTATMIYFYNRAYPAVCTPVTVISGPAGTGDIKVNITGVTGAGTLSQERIVIRNDGSQEQVLTGWTLLDAKGHAYTFPALTFHPGVKVQVHSAAGKDTPADLYWGLSAPAWSSGEMAVLYDTQRIARAFYRIP